MKNIRNFTTFEEYVTYKRTAEIMHLPMVSYIEEDKIIIIERAESESAVVDDEGNLYLNDGVGEALIKMFQIGNNPYLYVYSNGEYELYTSSGTTVITDD